jgi:hypothetical protein
MGSEKHSGDKVDLKDLSIDGRPVTRRRPEDLNTMTLDERDNGLYRDQLHAIRATYDPFESAFGEAWLADGLASRRARRLRWQAWVFLVIPSALLGGLGTLMAWDNVDASSRMGDYAMAVLTTTLWWLPASYWLYAIHRRRPAR